MKKSILLLLVAGLFTAMPVVAAEHNAMSAGECIQHCELQNEAIGVKIQRLQKEIKEGKKTYSAEELRKLEDKLKEANFMLDQINHP